MNDDPFKIPFLPVLNFLLYLLYVLEMFRIRGGALAVCAYLVRRYLGGQNG